MEPLEHTAYFSIPRLFHDASFKRGCLAYSAHVHILESNRSSWLVEFEPGAVSMAFLCVALVLFTLCGFVWTRSFAIPVHRESIDTTTGKPSESGIIESKLDRSLYWYGHFSVGDSHKLKLLIDTGSTDLIINPGLYGHL